MSNDGDFNADEGFDPSGEVMSRDFDAEKLEKGDPNDTGLNEPGLNLHGSSEGLKQSDPYYLIRVGLVLSSIAHIPGLIVTLVMVIGTVVYAFSSHNVVYGIYFACVCLVACIGQVCLMAVGLAAGSSSSSVLLMFDVVFNIVVVILAVFFFVALAGAVGWGWERHLTMSIDSSTTGEKIANTIFFMFMIGGSIASLASVLIIIAMIVHCALAVIYMIPLLRAKYSKPTNRYGRV